MADLSYNPEISLSTLPTLVTEVVDPINVNISSHDQYVKSEFSLIKPQITSIQSKVNSLSSGGGGSVDISTLATKVQVTDVKTVADNILTKVNAIPTTGGGGSVDISTLATKVQVTDVKTVVDNVLALISDDFYCLSELILPHGVPVPLGFRYKYVDVDFSSFYINDVETLTFSAKSPVSLIKYGVDASKVSVTIGAIRSGSCVVTIKCLSNFPASPDICLVFTSANCVPIVFTT